MDNKQRLDEIEETLRIHNELAKSQNQYLIDRVKTLTSALEFYADQKCNWFSAGLEGDSGSYDGQMGDKARKALTDGES